MPRPLSALLPSVAAVLLLAGPAPADTLSQPPKGFTALFNGKDLTGWHGMPTSTPTSWPP